jgi:hypothetical protein
MLQRFGVLVGHDRVVIYIEPDASLGATPDTPRAQLKIGGEPLPWSVWADSFGRQLPAPLAAMQQEFFNTADVDAREAIRKRLREIWDLLHPKRLRRIPTGPEVVRPDDRAPGSEPMPNNTDRKDNAPPGRQGGVDGDAYAHFALPPGSSGDDARQVRAQEPDPPEVSWVTIHDGSRVAGDLEERAGRYLPERHRLILNEDWPGFATVRAKLEARCAGVEGAPALIRARAREWFAQQVQEAVVGFLALQGSRYWSPDDLACALSEEAITAAAMPKWHVWRELNRAVAALGEPRAA